MTTRDRPWWVGLAPAQATVECGGQAHRLRWKDGALGVLDHRDPDGERALAALGGERCTCIELFDAWCSHARDPRVLTLASRGPSDLLAHQDADPRQPGNPRKAGWHTAPGYAVGRRTVGRGGPAATAIGPGPPAGNSEQRLGDLLTLAGGLSDRLVATVAAHWRQQLRAGGGGPVRAQLNAALYGRALASLQPWRESESDVHVIMVDEGEQVAAFEREGTAELRLPFGWICEVWARGLAVVWGRFCLSAHSDDGLRWELATVGPDLGPPAIVTLQLPPPV